jgi:hypothetical protein
MALESDARLLARAEGEMRGGGGPANNPCDYIRSVRKWLAQRPTERDERTWSCFWALMR